MDTHDFLVNVVYFLGAAVIAVPIFVRLGLGSVLGYLCAGIVIGPWSLGLISNVEDILHFSELGVVLLLFLIGLELEPKKLWDMRRSIVGSGVSQMLVSSVIIASVALFLGLNWQSAIIVGLGLALSSTAIALQTMQERGLMATPAGKTGFSILLFQDIAVIPIMAFLPLLAISSTAILSEHQAHSNLSMPVIIAILIGVFLGGRLLLRHVFRLIANTKLRELFTMLSLLLVIGIAVIMDSFGISMALGAFLAGVILADSEYRHTLESDISPFKGLLLGLFFVSVGMSINFGLLLEKPFLFVGLAILLVLIKASVLLFLAMFARLPNQQYPTFAVVLSQGGEFAFVLFGIAVTERIFDQMIASQLILVVVISMVLTPLLLQLNKYVIEPLFYKRSDSIEDTVDIEDKNNRVIVAGYGRFGQVVSRLMVANRIKPTLIDYNPDQIELVKKFGTKAYYGDVLRSEVLHAAGAENTDLIILAMDDAQTINHAVEMIRQDFPNAKIIARAIDRIHALELLELKVDHFTRETFYSALEMGKDALNILGFGKHAVERQVQALREHDIELLHQQFEVRNDEAALISKTAEARERLAQVLASEQIGTENQKE